MRSGTRLTTTLLLDAAVVDEQSLASLESLAEQASAHEPVALLLGDRQI